MLFSTSILHLVIAPRHNFATIGRGDRTVSETSLPYQRFCRDYYSSFLKISTQTDRNFIFPPLRVKELTTLFGRFLRLRHCEPSYLYMDPPGENEFDEKRKTKAEPHIG